MASNPSASVLVELQTAGENLNTWGDTRLNNALKMLEASGHGLTEHTLTANKSITHTNYTLTDGSDYVHKIAAASDAGYTLTFGGYERSYLIWNASSYDQTIATSGGGDSVTAYAGEIVEVYCDRTNMVRLDIRRLLGDLAAGGNKITGLGTPTANTDAVTKKYVDDEVLTAAAGNLPAATSNARKFVRVNDDADGYTLQDLNAPLWRWRRKRA